METVPQTVKDVVQRAMNRIKARNASLRIARETERRFGSVGRYEAECLDKPHMEIEGSLEKVEQFRGIAASKGIDAEAVFDELGGYEEPLDVSAAAQEWVTYWQQRKERDHGA